MFEDELRAVTGAADRLGFALQNHVEPEVTQKVLAGGQEPTPESVQELEPEAASFEPAADMTEEEPAVPDAEVSDEPEPEPELRDPEPREPEPREPEPLEPELRVTQVEAPHEEPASPHDEHGPTPSANPCPVCASTGDCTRCGGKGRRLGLKCSRCQGRGSCAVCAGVGYVWDDVSAPVASQTGY